MKRGAVAVDLGASSARFAAGRWSEGTLHWDVIEKIAHEPQRRGDHLYWDLERLLGICRRAKEYAEANFDRATLGIDTWGVDGTFVDEAGRPTHDLLCYRDVLHEQAFAELAPHHDRFYELTGVQNQPFNTLYKLWALRRERGERWRFLPDLLGDLTFGQSATGSELTIASTSQLLELHGRWCDEIFEILGYLPFTEPLVSPGTIRARAGNVTLVAVGGHDTASAVFGLEVGPDEAFLNVGTWSLLGALRDTPHLGDPLFTNERAVDGRVRYLANIPGFYVIQRAYEEQSPPQSIADWLAAAIQPERVANLLDSRFYHPDSMRKALAQGLPEPRSEAEWAGLALFSLVETTAEVFRRLRQVIPTPLNGLVVGGGGTRSSRFAEALELAVGVPVRWGPSEATVVGNLQFQRRCWEAVL